MHQDQHANTDSKASRHWAPGNRGCRGIVLVAALLAFASGAARAQPSLPQLDGNQHVGVVSCAGSTCHGALEPRDASNVLQNEFFTWHRRDRHARSWETLTTDRARRIAERLGLGPAEEAGTCLDCHADNVPGERRGPRFRISDGVGCEACHGGGGPWLRSHADADTTHADNLEAGLYPTEDPAARTRLCMSCHYSHPETPMTHRLMSAGHPPLLFDLDVFTQIQPRHYRVDADYRERKGEVSTATAWAAGEVASAGVVLETLAGGLGAGDGLFPELYHFDCASCHHPLGSGPGRSVEGLGPGDLRLEDAALRLAGHVAAGLDPELGGQWSQRLAALHAATREGGEAARAAAERLQALTPALRERLAGQAIDAQRGGAIMQRIVEAGVRSGFADRSWAEQATMALASLLAAAAEQGWFAAEHQQRLDARLEQLYAALEDDEYAPAGYRDALRGFAQAL